MKVKLHVFQKLKAFYIIINPDWYLKSWPYKSRKAHISLVIDTGELKKISTETQNLIKIEQKISGTLHEDQITFILSTAVRNIL